MSQSIRVSGLSGYFDLVTKLGGDPQLFAQQFGIKTSDLQHEEVWIPPQQLIYLYEHTAEQLGRSDFGLLMANHSKLDSLGVLAVAMQNSSTVEEAERFAIRYLNLQTTIAKFGLQVGTKVSRFELSLDLPNTRLGAIPQMEDYTLGFTHRQVRMLAGEKYRLLGVELRHAPLCQESVYRDFFNADIKFNASSSCLLIATDTLKSRLEDTSNLLRDMAIDHLTRRNTLQHTGIIDQVELAIRRSLGTDNCTREAIALALALHPRTLQRRLAQEGESFSQLLDKVRAKLARHYLCETDLPLAQISQLLGYSEQSIFSRKCRHWFKQTARMLRQSESVKR